MYPAINMVNLPQRSYLLDVELLCGTQVSYVNFNTWYIT